MSLVQDNGEGGAVIVESAVDTGDRLQEYVMVIDDWADAACSA